MGDVWHRGLLTETHAIRVAQLQSMRRRSRWRATSARLIQQSSKRGDRRRAAVGHGRASSTSQALRIDARSGALKAVGSRADAPADRQGDARVAPPRASR